MKCLTVSALIMFLGFSCLACQKQPKPRQFVIQYIVVNTTSEGVNLGPLDEKLGELFFSLPPNLSDSFSITCWQSVDNLDCERKFAWGTVDTIRVEYASGSTAVYDYSTCNDFGKSLLHRPIAVYQKTGAFQSCGWILDTVLSDKVRYTYLLDSLDFSLSE